MTSAFAIASARAGSTTTLTLERSGTLIANSGAEPPFTTINEETKRLQAVDSPNPIVKTICNGIEAILRKTQVLQSQSLSA